MAKQTVTLSEIQRQPETWAEAIASVQRIAPRLMGLFPPATEVAFTGCGTSYYLAIAAARFFQEITGRPTCAVPASELLLRRESHLVSDRPVVMVGFSRSGETTETLLALHRHREMRGGPTVALVCRAGATMTKEADLVIEIPSADDKSVVMTSSFTSMLLAAVYMGVLVCGNVSVREEIEGLPSVLQDVLPDARLLGETVGRNGEYQRFVFLGMGPFYGLASEGMLKLKEMTQVPCETYSTLEFRHGPISIVAPGTLVVALVSGRTAKQEQAVLADVRRLGAQTLQLGWAAECGVPGLSFAVGKGLSEVSQGLLSVPVLQFIAYYRAIAAGLNPDRPRHLSQVVVLKEQDLLPAEQ